MLAFLGMLTSSTNRGFEESCFEVEESEVEELISRFSRRKEAFTACNKMVAEKFHSVVDSNKAQFQNFHCAIGGSFERENFNGTGAYLII